ncbi:cyclic lactone autoinducer peptide [Enterococcus sp. BWB1-3]|nr:MULTISPECIES: cyclic lactone autoinducer peptide [unclassified Enterococcus]MBL1228817.1 cyclic lactone autoinducer peptide [Enterococcus sp. BWB1-3]MCB5953742.1 cyclic lactone autoinducer peptide [Enterococcus sp. CWB-B31]
MMGKLKGKMMDLLAVLLVSGGELSINQCCIGFGYEIEIPEELLQ